MDAEAIAKGVVQDAVSPMAAAGCARCTGEIRSWRVETGGDRAYFDLASLTKPMTALAIARLDSTLRVRPLEALLPETRGTHAGRMSIEMLLSHRAGLLANLPLYEALLEGRGISRVEIFRHAADAVRPDAVLLNKDMYEPLYSDLGYILAGEALARASGSVDAGAAIGKLVLAPLGLTKTIGTARDLFADNSHAHSHATIAPTEDVSWRGGIVCGLVHDENAFALTRDGGSGHAGMFGTIDGVIAFGCAIVDALDGASHFATPAQLKWLVEPRPGGSLRAGFDGKSEGYSSMGTILGERTFGHLGFTGTSLWIDPDAKTVVALLTNRVSPSRQNLRIREARPRVHDALAERARRI